MKKMFSRTSRAISRNSGPAALVVAVLALIVSTAGVATAVSIKGPSTKPRPYGVLALSKKKKFPASVIPKVKAAKSADKLSTKGFATIREGCASDSLDVGTFCIEGAFYPVPVADEGKTDYFYATKACAALGGWLPSAAELIGAVNQLALASTIDDSVGNASIDEIPQDGLKDRREMTSTLVTTAAGSGAAGSQGVTAGSRGDPNQNEADPIAQPANPQPNTLQYVTVYDNHDLGGFAGSAPVTQSERFRCAFAKQQKRDRRTPAQ